MYEIINLSYFFSGSSNRVVCQGVVFYNDLDSGWVLDGNSIARSSSTYHYFPLSSLVLSNSRSSGVKCAHNFGLDID